LAFETWHTNLRGAPADDGYIPLVAIAAGAPRRFQIIMDEAFDNYLDVACPREDEADLVQKRERPA
jgi:hypothetical protein